MIRYRLISVVMGVFILVGIVAVGCDFYSLHTEPDDSQSDVYAQSGSVTVTNFTQFNIVFTFSFTRNDGQVISGSYDGNYYMPN